MFCFDFVRWITLASRHLLTNCSVVKFFSAFLTSASSFALVLLICIFCIVLPFGVVNDGDMITCWRSPASVGLCFQILYPCVAPRPHCGTSITRSRICPCSFILPSGAYPSSVAAWQQFFHNARSLICQHVANESKRSV